MTNIECEVPYSFGFRILARKQRLKLDLDARGAAGLNSLIAACIASGITTEEEIVDEISDITGLHNEHLIRLLLMEGENIDWRKNSDGTFAPSLDDRAMFDLPVRELI